MQLKLSRKTILIGATAVGLLLLTRKFSSAIPTNIPPTFDGELQDALKGSGYEGTRENWEAIAKMETTGFTSSVWKNANNPWGMKVAVLRPSHQDGAYVGTSAGTTQFLFAKYSTVHRACQDILDYMVYTKFPKGSMSLEKFISEMNDRGYFGSESYDSYLAKVRAWLKR